MNWQLFREGDDSRVLVHPDDAVAAGLADGDEVDVVTAAGSIRLAVRVTTDIVAGAVSMVHGVESANVNALLDRNDLDPLSGMAHLSGVPVTLQRA
jgi:anaerobic selenocysteine-containing dehydrogenase